MGSEIPIARQRLDTDLGDRLHVAIDIRIRQVLFAIRDAPAPARREVPWIAEPDLFGQVKADLDCSNERCRFPKVGALMKVQPVDAQSGVAGHSSGGNDLVGSHAELAVHLAGLSVGMLRPHRNPRLEPQP